MSVPQTVIDQLKRDEGLKLSPYQDTVGKLTIGYGRNLSDKGITAIEAQILLANDVAETTERLKAALPQLKSLDQVRYSVLINMAFNMGVGGVLQFTQFIAALEEGNWQLASLAMLNSKWATEVGDRATRLANQIVAGEWQ
jgi:lysozyme